MSVEKRSIFARHNHQSLLVMFWTYLLIIWHRTCQHVGSSWRYCRVELLWCCQVRGFQAMGSTNEQDGTERGAKGLRAQQSTCTPQANPNPNPYPNPTPTPSSTGSSLSSGRRSNPSANDVGVDLFTFCGSSSTFLCSSFCKNYTGLSAGAPKKGISAPLLFAGCACRSRALTSGC